jgi:hypothetical protein
VRGSGYGSYSTAVGTHEVAGIIESIRNVRLKLAIAILVLDASNVDLVALTVPAKKADIGHRPDCLLELPNFVHRASGLTVEWYKYIGRGMEVKNMPADLSPILADCLRDIQSA